MCAGLGLAGAHMRVERVLDEAMLEAIYRLRVAAWRARVPEFPAMERWTDAFDAEALHWAVVEDGAPVAAARLTVHDSIADAPDAEIYSTVFPRGLPEPFGVISRLCVAPGHGGRGLTRLLDEVRVDFARRCGCLCLVGITTFGVPRAAEMAETGFTNVISTVNYRSGPLSHVRGRAMTVMMKPLGAESHRPSGQSATLP